jgi:hypothetical protein
MTDPVPNPGVDEPYVIAVGPVRPVAPMGVKVNVEKLYKYVVVFVTMKLGLDPATPVGPVAVTTYGTEEIPGNAEHWNVALVVVLDTSVIPIVGLIVHTRAPVKYGFVLFVTVKNPPFVKVWFPGLAKLAALYTCVIVHVMSAIPATVWLMLN